MARHAETAAMQYWTELSSGYQTVKAVMERDGDVERAQRYHRYEIETRLWHRANACLLYTSDAADE